MKKNKLSWNTGAWVCLSLSLTHCTSVKNQGLGPKSEFSNEPIVEAYLEFPGPRRLWAGPQTVIFHVTARDGDSPNLSITPAYFQSAAAESDATIVKRAISSESQADTAAPQILKIGTRMKMPIAAVRDELSDIIDAFEDTAAADAATGCAFPIRLKMIRTNGAVIEKWGCRGDSAWTKIASEAASRFLASASFTERAPSSATLPDGAREQLAPAEPHASAEKAHDGEKGEHAAAVKSEEVTQKHAVEKSDQHASHH